MPGATIKVRDETGTYTGSLDLLARNAVAAFDEWRPLLAQSVATLRIDLVLVQPREEYLATGGSAIFVSTMLGPSVETGVAFKLRTGVDLRPDGPDIIIELDADFADSRVQPNPLDGSALDPSKVNLVSVLAHEIGHGLGFDGYLDRKTYEGDPHETYRTTFDSFTTVVDGAPFFTGPHAVALYGGPVPQSREHLYHVGNLDGPGSAISRDVMFYAANLGTTHPGVLDGAILSDIGLATIFADVLNGSQFEDTMYGGSGDDEIYGFSAQDQLFGEAGADYLRGGDGADSLDGGSGFDDLNGNAGDDREFGGPGPDWVVGGKDNDLVSGDEGDDIVYGNLGNDWCDGGAGADVVRGGQGDDTLFGQEGDDWLSGDKGDDTLTGGAGADVFHSFGDAGVDRVTDFSRAQGDRVQLDPGTVYTVAQAGADVVISMTGGGQVILVGVQQASLTGDWIFGA